MACLPLADIELLASGGAAIAGGVLTGEPDQLDAQFAAAHAEFVRWTSGAPIQIAWRTAIDFPAPAIASVAALADVVVVGPARKSSPANSYLDSGDLVMRAGRPVLMVPQGSTTLDRGTVVVAWRNTRESRRALADAMPVDETAAAVTLLHVQEAADDAEELASIDDARAFVKGHGVEAKVEFVDAGHRPAGQAIAEFAGRAQAGLIVAGTYGHSRVREWAFGGVTRDMLQEARIACLFSR